MLSASGFLAWSTIPLSINQGLMVLKIQVLNFPNLLSTFRGGMMEGCEDWGKLQGKTEDTLLAQS